MSVKEAPKWVRDHSSRILTAGMVLALLYFGRSVLIPLALAVMLSLLMAPLVRALKRLGFGRTSSVLVTVVALTLLWMGLAIALGTQILHIAASLPQYESNVQRKLETLEEVAIGPLVKLTDETSRLIESRESAQTLPVHGGEVERSLSSAGPSAAVLAPPDFGSQPLQLMWTILRSVWGPVQFAGIVLLVLIFVLLEHESLRDRFIRIQRQYPRLGTSLHGNRVLGDIALKLVDLEHGVVLFRDLGGLVGRATVNHHDLRDQTADAIETAGEVPFLVECDDRQRHRESVLANDGGGWLRLR